MTKPARVPMAAGVQTGVSNSVIVRSGQMTVSEPRRDWCLVFDDDVLGRGGESEWQCMHGGGCVARPPFTFE